MVSIFPCDVHGRRALARLGSAYVTLARGSAKRSRKLRVCTACLADFHKTHESDWSEVGLDDEVSLAEMCAACEKDLSDGQEKWTLFCTTYGKGDDRRDFFAFYCPVDADALAGTYGLVDS